MNTIRHLIIALVCVAPVVGFSPRSQYRHVVSNGECFVVLDPFKKPEIATAFQVTDDGFKQLWQSKGWFGYDNEIFLASDGMSLVRIQRIPNTLDGRKIQDLSVLFIYFKGKLMKEYKLSELVRDMGSIQNIGSMGGIVSLWMDEAEIVQTSRHGIDTDRKDDRLAEQTYHSYNDFAFRLKTLERNELFIDLLDGRRIEKKIVDAQGNKGASGKPFENKKSEQGGADQPATAPELKSEGKDKPQPESKVRPR